MNDRERDVLIHYGILGMKWGVRRYQNEDGTLTEAGKKRYERDIRENNAKKKDNRIKDLEKTGPDPKRWTTEDLERTKTMVDSSSNLLKTARDIEKQTTIKPTIQRLDLSKMSDQELRNAINRELLERQYNNLFNEAPPEQVTKGRQFTREALDVTGTVLGIAGSALGLALAIKKLKGV